MSHPATGVRRRTRLIASLASVGLVTGLGALTAPTHADEPPTPKTHAMAKAAATSAFSAGAVLKSSKGKKLQVTLSASVGSAGSLTVALTDKDGENHIWTFQVPKKTLKLNKAGKGKLVTKKIKPYGKIKLKITPTKKWKTTKCQGKVITKKRALKVQGLFVFNTKSEWGKVGGKKVKFKGAQLVKHTGNDGTACSGNSGGGGGDGDAACSGDMMMWSGFAEDGTVMSSQWTSGDTATHLIASRTVELAKPKGAMRTDFRSAKVPVPTVTSAGDAVTLEARSQAPAAGSATLSSSLGASVDRECTDGSVETQRFWYGVSYVNGGTPLQVKMTAFGTLKLPNSAQAVIQERRVS